MSGMCLQFLSFWAEVPHAAIHTELSLLAVLRVDAGRSGVVYSSPETELHLAPEEGAGWDGAQIVLWKLMSGNRFCHFFRNIQSDMSTSMRTHAHQ